MWPIPASSLPRTSAPVTSRPSTFTVPATAAAQPGQRLHQLALAVVVDAGDADDLARAHLEGDALHGGQPAVVDHLEVGDLEQRLARLGRLLGDAEEHVAPDHHARERLLGRALGRHRLDLLAAPQHAHAVGDVEHLAELVGDEDDRLALRGQRAQDPEQLLRLLRGQHRGRLVEDQHVGAAVERAQDLDALLGADRDVGHPRVGVDREPEAVGELAHAPGRRLRVQQQPLARLVGEDDVLRHRHHRDEHEVLEHHADPELDGPRRRVDHDRLAVQVHLALVRAVEPVEDAHQRRLAGAVLAQQGVDLALAQVEIDAVVRDDRAESLGDAPELEGERGIAAARGYLPSSVGMSVISPEAIWSWTFLTSASNGWPAA